jgi:hypothetical protein
MASFLPLQHTKTYHAENEVETLQLQKADFREAMDRTADKDGYSVLRSALVRIFIRMLVEVRARIEIVRKCVERGRREGKRERVRRRKGMGEVGLMTVGVSEMQHARADGVTARC